MSRLVFASFALAAAALTFAGPSLSQPRADTLLVDRAAASKSVGGPKRGTLMSKVEAQYGAPESKLEPRGGQKSQWPQINRWVYPEFIIYFENSHVIDVVARHATPGEIGPKPVH